MLDVTHLNGTGRMRFLALVSYRVLQSKFDRNGVPTISRITGKRVVGKILMQGPS
jgi:hypothetical protein